MWSSSSSLGPSVLHLQTTLFLQLKILNVGLARCDALVLIPIYQAFWIVSSIVAGLVYFEEYTTLNTLDIVRTTASSKAQHFARLHDPDPP